MLAEVLQCENGAWELMLMWITYVDVDLVFLVGVHLGGVRGSCLKVSCIL